MNPSLFNRIISFQVSEPNILSDHCAVESSMSYKNECDTSNAEDGRTCDRVKKKISME